MKKKVYKCIKLGYLRFNSNIGLGSSSLFFYLLLFDITFSSQNTYMMSSFSITLYNTKKKQIFNANLWFCSNLVTILNEHDSAM